ncbi:MAG TPA: zf-HC2 domain-containing protein [Vicinamibacterales bacterium]|jgi:hypothetical protein
MDRSERRSEDVTSTAGDREPAFDRLVADSLARQTAAPGNACPDTDLLAAWFDRSLVPVEAGRIEAHAAGCGECQRILADLARSEPEVTRAAPLPLPPRPLFWHWRWLVPVAAAVVLLVVGGRTLVAPTRPPELIATEGQMAQSKPAPADVVPAAPPAAADLAQTRSSAPASQAENAAREPDRAAAPAPSVRQLPAAAPSAGGGASPVAADTALSPRLTAVASRAETAAPGVETRQVGAQKSAMRADRESSSSLLVTSVPGTPVLWRYGDAGTIERSGNHGQTWQRQSSGADVALLDASAPSASVCWIVGAAGLVLRTVDGETWQRVASPTSIDLVSVRAWSGTAATIAAKDRTEYSTTDGGGTWVRR